MATITQITKEEDFTQVTFRSNSEKEYRLFLDKVKGTATVYTDFVHYMNYGHEKTGHAYKVFTGTIEEITKHELEVFLGQFK